MSRSILVIGGTRLFGKLLVEQLVRAGHDVTICSRGRAADPFGGAVRRIRVDRRDEAAMHSAFGAGSGYDVVYDQMCYRAADAASAIRVFGGRVARYVMASTIEVYDGHYGRPAALREQDLDLEALDPTTPWTEAESDYGLGKRLAEQAFHRAADLRVVAVRIGHVLAGVDDFTGRLAWYVRRTLRGEPLRYSAGNGASSFIGAGQIAALMIVGPVNAASVHLSALDLHCWVARVLGREVPAVPVADAPRSTLSPFDHAVPYVLDTRRTAELVDPTTRWLDEAIIEHAAAAEAP